MPKSTSKKKTKSLPRKKASTRRTGGKTANSNAIALLSADHRKVEKLFKEFEKTDDRERKSALTREICGELIVHTRLEEQIFYPACRENDVEDDDLDEAQVEHDSAKLLIVELLEGSPDDEYYDAKMKVLSEYIKHHVKEEEQPREGIFAKAKKAGVDLEAVGENIKSTKVELMADIEAILAERPKIRSLSHQS